MKSAPYRHPLDRDFLEKMEMTKAKDGGHRYRVNFGDHIDDMNFVKRLNGYDHPCYVDWKWLCENNLSGPILFSDFFSWWKKLYKPGFYLVVTDNHHYEYVPYRGQIKRERGQGMSERLDTLEHFKFWLGKPKGFSIMQEGVYTTKYIEWYKGQAKKLGVIVEFTNGVITKLEEK